MSIGSSARVLTNRRTRTHTRRRDRFYTLDCLRGRELCKDHMAIPGISIHLRELSLFTAWGEGCSLHTLKIDPLETRKLHMYMYFLFLPSDIFALIFACIQHKCIVLKSPLSTQACITIFLPNALPSFIPCPYLHHPSPKLHK